MEILKQLLEENKQTLSKNGYKKSILLLNEYETNNDTCDICDENELQTQQKSINICNILIDLLEEKKELITDQSYIDSYNILSKLRLVRIRNKQYKKQIKSEYYKKQVSNKKQVSHTKRVSRINRLLELRAYGFLGYY